MKFSFDLVRWLFSIPLFIFAFSAASCLHKKYIISGPTLCLAYLVLVILVCLYTLWEKKLPPYVRILCRFVLLLIAYVCISALKLYISPWIETALALWTSQAVLEPLGMGSPAGHQSSPPYPEVESPGHSFMKRAGESSNPGGNMGDSGPSNSNTDPARDGVIDAVGNVIRNHEQISQLIQDICSEVRTRVPGEASSSAPNAVQQQREAGPYNQPLPVEAYPYTDTEVIGGDSVSAIQRRLLFWRNTLLPLRRF